MSLEKAIALHNRKKSYAYKMGNPRLVEDYYNMSKLFQQKAWNTYPGAKAILEAHVRLLSKLTDDEKDLYLDLTERFTWIRDYTTEIIEQLNRILNQFNAYSTYYVMRCMPIKDQKWSKSSGVVLYEIKNPEVRQQLVKPIRILDRIEDIAKEKNINKGLFILVDDFVGTADTAEKCIDDILKKHPELLGKIVVMSVAALEQGKQKLSSMNVCLFASYILKKGISDFYTGMKLLRNKQLMQQIEAHLRVSKDFNFGYGGSEALICMKRCPNNTFPIYWHDTRYSPYPRY